MNTSLEPGTALAGLRRLIRAGDGGIVSRLASVVCSLALCAGLAGCSFLKPAPSTARHFVLTPASAPAPVAASASLAVGVGKVKLPAYLFDSSLAVRIGTNEIGYLPSVIWAERLDTGFQRVLAANLSVLLTSDRVRLSSWQKEDVAAEVYVVLDQFDVDSNGQGVLAARWRIAAPGGEKTLTASGSRVTRQGPAPGKDPSAAIATLSELAADLSRQIAQAIADTSKAKR